MIATGSAYLRIVGPAYGFFGLGLSLYFASQGAGRLFWPLFFGFLRVFISIVGGWLVLRWTGSLEWMFAAWRWAWSCSAPRSRSPSAPAPGFAGSDLPPGRQTSCSSPPWGRGWVRG